jgi:hypothetical protein
MWAPSPIHVFPRQAKFDQVQIHDWDEEVEKRSEPEFNKKLRGSDMNK